MTEPNHPAALCLLGEIGLRIGATLPARTFLNRARALGDDRAAALLTASESAAQSTRPPQVSAPPRFLVIKSWGFGFWSEISHVLGGLLLAEITGRTPVVHLGEECRFGGTPTQDAFTFYFEPVSGVKLSDVTQMNPVDRFPAKWRTADLTREGADHYLKESVDPLDYISVRETVAVSDAYIGVSTLVSWIPPWHHLSGKSTEEVYRDLIARYLRPTAEMNALCQAYYDRHLKQAPYVAVHLRGDDKAGEVDLHGHYNEAIMGLVDEVPADKPLFLMTDNTRWLDIFRTRYGGRVIAPEANRDAGTAVHFCLAREGDPRLNGVEVLRDTLLATRAESFIGSGISNVATMVGLFRRWPADKLLLVSAPTLLQPIPYFYLDSEFHGDHRRLHADEYVELSDAV